MTELSARERRHQRTREAILDAARRIIHESGPAGLSLREIARRIDYSPAALYEYFGGKEEIVEEVCAEGFRRLTHYLLTADPALPALEYLQQMGMNYVSFARANPDFFLLMFTTAPLQAHDAEAGHTPRSGSLEEDLRESPAFMALYNGVERAVREGALPTRPDRPVFAMAISLWQSVHGIAMLAITVGRNYDEYPAYVERTLRIILRGLQV